MMEAMQRAFWNGVPVATTRPEVPSAKADSACRVHPPMPVIWRLRSADLARHDMEHMNIDLNEYGIDVGGDEALREAVSVAVALETWGERFRAEKFARGEAVVVGRDGKAFLEGPEGHFRPVPKGRPLTWEDLKFRG